MHQLLAQRGCFGYIFSTVVNPIKIYDDNHQSKLSIREIKSNHKSVYRSIENPAFTMIKKEASCKMNSFFGRVCSSKSQPHLVVFWFQFSLCGKRMRMKRRDDDRESWRLQFHIIFIHNKVTINTLSISLFSQGDEEERRQVVPLPSNVFFWLCS